jgi:Lipopolysaccharide-assembly
MSSRAQPADAPPRRLRRSAGLTAAAVLALGLAACAHYQLGTGGKLTFTTLYVAPVGNRAPVPQAQALVATAIREALLRDGRVTLVDSPENADVTLRVDLTGYDRDMAAANPADTGLARKFALHLHARCTLTDNRSHQPLFAGREITVTKDAFTDSGQLQAEYQTLPLLADALADRVAHAVLDVW